MARRAPRLRAVMLAVTLLSLAPASPAGAAEGTPGQITGDHRLMERFVEDGAIVQKGWVEAVAQYAGFDEGRDLSGTLRGAFRLGRDVEAGFAGGLLQRRREAGTTLFGSTLGERVEGRGFADTLVYGKYRILRSPFELAVGAGVDVPLGEEDSGLGPGVVQYRAFMGLRKALSRATLVWSLGASARGAARSPGEASGRTAGLAGAGILVPVGAMWTFVAEASYEGARFEADRSEGRALAGLDWRPTENVVVRGVAGGGLTSDAPARLASLSLAYHF